MSLRERVVRLLSGSGHEADPDEYVHLTTVRVTEGPLLQTRLVDAGIDAIGTEEYHAGVGATTHFRIEVRRRDLDAATRLTTH